MSSWLHSLFACMTHRRRVTSPISERCKAEGQEARTLRYKHRASFSFGSDRAISRAEHFIVLKEFTSKTPAHYHNASHKFIQRETIPEGRWVWGSYARYWRLRFACWRHNLFTVFLFPTPFSDGFVTAALSVSSLRRHGHRSDVTAIEPH